VAPAGGGGGRPWYETAFGEHYPALYAHRDRGEAEAAIGLVAGRVPLYGRRVLDVGCGEGRHLAALAARGVEAWGVDLSPVLVRRAARHVGIDGRRALLVRGDMRFLPFLDATFDVVLSMFTSFGYFVEAGEDGRALAEMARVLRPGGTSVLDYLDEASVRATLVPRSSRQVGELKVSEIRRIDPSRRCIVKEVTVTRAGRPEAAYEERVALYTEEDLTRLLRSAGLRPVERFGGYDGRAFLPGSSSRLILFAEKVEAASHG